MAEIKKYDPIPTIREFHECGAQKRCVVGPVGSAKSTAGIMEVAYYLPMFLFETYGIKETVWIIVRNTYSQLEDSTLKTFLAWFPNADVKGKPPNALLRYPGGIRVHLWFRACDRPDQTKMFKSMEVTGALLDESVEISENTKKMIKNRLGRFPSIAVWNVPDNETPKFFVEVTNPPDITMPIYSQYKWRSPPPGPKPEGEPLEKHVGFWQPPYENLPNLPANYYEDLQNDYRDFPDWIDMYILGKPGVIVQGKLVYNNFKRDVHEAADSLIWNKSTLYRGWDNSGNCPACVVVQRVTTGQFHLLKEFYSQKMNIADFTKYVITECNIAYPNAEYVDWADPAGENKYSTKIGGFTSNAMIMRAIGLDVKPSEQNPSARIGSVDGILAKRDGLLIDPSCNLILNGFLGGYCYPEAGNTGIYGEKPIKNKFSHPHDAFQYIMVKLVANHPAVAKSFNRKRIPALTSGAEQHSWMRG